MKILRTMICAALLVAGLSGCEKIDVNKLEGTWIEQYDPTVFAMDGSVTFTFDGNNGYQLHVYDALSGESHDYSGHYAIDLINKGTITINQIESTLLGAYTTNMTANLPQILPPKHRKSYRRFLRINLLE